MNITVFLEGRPGHEKQSLAIAAALKDLYGADVEKVQIKNAHLLQRILDLCRYLLLPDGGCRYRLSNTDLLIGTGSQSHIPLLSCKKKYSVPVVSCMTPDLYLRPFFDLCCVPRHDGLKGKGNIFLTDGPPVMEGPEISRGADAGLILIGGVDARSHIWNTFEIISNVRNIVDHNPTIHWNISSSPRTPHETVELLAALDRDIDNVSFFHFKDTPRGWVEEQYARASYAWVTADSISMVYEAITAGCKVGILPVQWKKSDNKFVKSLQYLEARGLVVCFAEGKTYDGLFDGCNPADFNEAKRCAGEIIRRFFPSLTA